MPPNQHDAVAGHRKLPLLKLAKVAVVRHQESGMA